MNEKSLQPCWIRNLNSKYEYLVTLLYRCDANAIKSMYVSAICGSVGLVIERWDVTAPARMAR